MAYIDIDQIVEELRKEASTWDDHTQRCVFFNHLVGASPASFQSHLGRYIRNRYGFWKHEWKPEIRNGIDCSPQHPDAISAAIIKKLIELGPLEIDTVNE